MTLSFTITSSCSNSSIVLLSLFGGINMSATASPRPRQCSNVLVIPTQDILVKLYAGDGLLATGIGILRLNGSYGDAASRGK